jgi:uncharacterized membrane protein
MNTQTNIAGAERWATAIGGAALAVYGLKRIRDERSMPGAMITAAASALIARSATGFCPAYAAAGINTAERQYNTREALGGRRGVAVDEAVTINRPASELYRFWRNFSELPRFMNHLVSVSCSRDQRFSHWVAKAPAGRTVEWDARVINDVPNELIGWRTLGKADVVSAGSVRFIEMDRGRGTQVRVHLQYEPPIGKLGATVAWLLGHEPSQTIREDLRRFKQIMEAGEVPTTKGQPRGGRS